MQFEFQAPSRRLDPRRFIEREAAAAWAARAGALALVVEDPLDRELLRAIAEGLTMLEAARAVGLPRSTARYSVMRLLSASRPAHGSDARLRWRGMR